MGRVFASSIVIFPASTALSRLRHGPWFMPSASAWLRMLSGSGFRPLPGLRRGLASLIILRSCFVSFTSHPRTSEAPCTALGVVKIVSPLRHQVHGAAFDD